MTRPSDPHSGTPPPAEVTLPDGDSLALRPLAEEIADRHLEHHPDEIRRHGAAAREWTIQDTQHVLHWAALDLMGFLELGSQVRWLSSVLHHRGYAIESLAASLETAADVVEDAVASPVGDALGARLRAAVSAVVVPGRGSMPFDTPD